MTQNAVSTPLKNVGIPLHRQLFLCLRDRIYRGIYAPGSPIPNEVQLCALFEVSRITVRRALADLEAKGLLLRKQRLGTFVHPDFQPARQTGTLAFLDALESTALDALPSQPLLIRKEVPPADIAALLELPEGVPAQHTRRLRSENGTPVVLSDAWVPLDLLKGVAESALRKHLLYQVLLAGGVTFDRVVQEISAESADPDNAALLRTEVGAPLLRVTRLLHDTAARPVQHLTARSSPDRSRMLMDVSASSIGSLGAGALAHDA
jgi:GntR family transcriptional regulator